MSDAPKFFKRRKKKATQEGNQEPTKEENEVGKFLRWNCPSKPSTMMGQKVEYFIGSKAVDCLMDSKWASGKSGAEILFTDRESVETYLDRLLVLGFFSRVTRIKKLKKSDEEKEKEKEKEKGGGKDDSEGKKLKKKKPKKEKPDEGKPSEGTGDSEGKKKRKVKVKLEMQEEQMFLDGDEEAYVWIFDPVHPKTVVMGVLVVIAAIAICLFPLWPSNVRECVWYLSVTAAAAVGLILILAILRYVFFAIVWVLTGGKHHFWLLPNLTEECGFFESFVPFYTHEYKGSVPSQEGEDGNDKEEENEEDKEEERGEEDNSSEEKEPTEKDSWVKLTEEEVESARSEVEKHEDEHDSLESEVKC